MRVIAVDDEKLSLMKIERILSEISGVEFIAGYQYPAEALANEEKDAPELAFLDVEMPGMDGLTLCEQLMEKRPDIEVVFVTAYEKYAINAYQTNAIGYLLKPVQPEDIAAQIGRIQRYKKPIRSGAAKPYFKSFGQFVIRVDKSSTDLFRFRTEKSEELLAYLLCHRGLPVTRDTLCEALWPEMDADKATRNFHTTAYNIRRSFAEAGLNDLLQRVHESYLLSPQRYDSDFDVFCNAVERFSKNAVTLEELESAVALYDGALMADKDYCWLIDMQSVFENRYEKMALRLCDSYRARGEAEKAELCARQLLRHIPLSEEACQRLIQLSCDSGKIDEAKRIYDDFRKVFRQEMGTEPHLKRPK